MIKQILYSLRDRYYRWQYGFAAPGTRSWLIGAELKYGGLQVNVPRNKVSDKDPRTSTQIRTGGMTGGDRMLRHGYAGKYSEYLLPFVEKGARVTLAEFGILKGTGLAIWCDLFENGRIIGFDIDLGHTIDNMDNLIAMGAFKNNKPELYEFDQFVGNTEYLDTVLKTDRLDICIDDGFHSNESILNTLKSTVPYLAEQFVYFVEDNAQVHSEIRRLYPGYLVENYGELTVISPRQG